MKHAPSAWRPSTHRRGMTFVELMLALAILSILSTAVFNLVFASSNLNRYTVNQSDAVWEADLAWHRIYQNALAAVPPASGGMTPTVTTDANGQARVKFIVPDIANGTTRTLQYYCTGAAPPFTLVEDDPRYDVGGAPNPIAHKVLSFAASIDTSTTFKIWCDLRITPKSGWIVRRHFCTNCRDF